MTRMPLVGCRLGIRSEPRLCAEAHLNLAYRRFRRLDLPDRAPDHPILSKTRHGRFRESDLLREAFEATVRACIAAGLTVSRARPVTGSGDHDRMAFRMPAAPCRRAEKLTASQDRETLREKAF